MSSQIQPYSGNAHQSGAPAWSPQGRAISRIVASTELDTIRTVANTHREMARIDAVEAVTQRAMQSTAMLAQLEGQLIEAVPAAAFRIAQIGQAHTLAMMGEIHSFGRNLR